MTIHTLRRVPIVGLVAALLVLSSVGFVYVVFLDNSGPACMLQPVVVAGQPQPTARTPAEDAEYGREHCEPALLEPTFFFGVGYVVIVGVAISAARSR